MDISRSILTKEQLDFGLSLREVEDYAFLIKGGEKLATFNSKTVTINRIRDEADQVIQESKNGVTYGKV